MKRGAVVCLLALLPALAACGSHRDPDQHSARSSGPLYTPNGEPLSGGRLGHPSCQDALAGWFDRVDATHAGRIDLMAFLADARRQFAAMDIDHDGQLTSDELTRYRAAYTGERGMLVAAEDDTLRPDQSAPAPSTGTGGGRGGGHSGGDKGSRGLPGESYGVNRGSRRGADTGARDTARDRPDPVMIADVTMRGRVSLTAFLAYERGNFAELDTNHDGWLGRDEITRSCLKP